MRLREMHSHWLSRKKKAIVLRGIRYTERCTHFLLAPNRPTAEGRITSMHCFCVPSHWQVSIVQLPGLMHLYLA